MPKTQPFDEHLDRYDNWFEEHRFVYSSEVEAVRHFIPPGKKGVEIGVGTGRFALPLGIKVGVEPSDVMARFAARKGLLVIRGVAEALPFADSVFDFALMVTTVCFVDYIEGSFREAHRILKPNGRFIVGLVDRDSPLGKFYEKMKNENVFYRVATFYSSDEVTHYLKEVGFGDIEMVQTVFGDLQSIKEIQPYKEGCGEGGFVVIKATKVI
ncbi:MAG: SAM-dependent methyltransferase [Calditrichaeota bacterium]|nr:MAG: SAM-dependent methyltransferase [Calditrichota bacterium]